MKPSIYEVYVPIENQEQADRMLVLCKDYNLPYWKMEKHPEDESVFFYDETDFWITDVLESVQEIKLTHPQITEQEFINLLKEKR